MQPPKPTDTHVVVRATEKFLSPGVPSGTVMWSNLIKDSPLIEYVPAQAFRLADSGEVTITWESDPYKEAA